MRAPLLFAAIPFGATLLSLKPAAYTVANLFLLQFQLALADASAQAQPNNVWA